MYGRETKKSTKNPERSSSSSRANETRLSLKIQKWDVKFPPEAIRKVNECGGHFKMVSEIRSVVHLTRRNQFCGRK